MTTTILLAGDVMLGRGVNDRLDRHDPAWPWGDLLPGLWAADLFLVNLECALTPRTAQWRGAGYKPFHFRSAPEHVESLRRARVDFASVANNHVADFGFEGMLDTLRVLDEAGIHHAGAGPDLAHASQPARLVCDELRVAVVGAADHPLEWGASERSPGIFHVVVSPNHHLFSRVERAIAEARAGADLVIFSIHWGPNMRAAPPLDFREFARRVIACGADVFWGHSAHVVQGVEVVDERPVLYDTGDFLDDYAVDEALRNDCSALFRLRLERGRVAQVELLPVRIEGCRVQRARGADREWFERWFRARCDELGTPVLDLASGEGLVDPGGATSASERHRTSRRGRSSARSGIRLSRGPAPRPEVRAWQSRRHDGMTAARWRVAPPVGDRRKRHSRAEVAEGPRTGPRGTGDAFRFRATGGSPGDPHRACLAGPIPRARGEAGP